MVPARFPAGAAFFGGGAHLRIADTTRGNARTVRRHRQFDSRTHPATIAARKDRLAVADTISSTFGPASVQCIVAPARAFETASQAASNARLFRYLELCHPREQRAARAVRLRSTTAAHRADAPRAVATNAGLTRRTDVGPKGSGARKVVPYREPDQADRVLSTAGRRLLTSSPLTPRVSPCDAP